MPRCAPRTDAVYRYATETTSTVAASDSVVTLLAANASRVSGSIYNDSSAVLRVKFGTGASATSFKYLVAVGGMLEFPQPIYTGIVTGIWATATGNARIGEGV